MLTSEQLIDRLRNIKIETFIEKIYRRIEKSTISKINKFYAITFDEGSSDESESIRLSIKLAFEEDENEKIYRYLFNKIKEKLKKN